MQAVILDLDQIVLDRARSLKDFTLWQARGMLRNSIADADSFSKRFIELDANGMIWKDQVYSILVEEFEIHDWTVEELLTSWDERTLSSD